MKNFLNLFFLFTLTICIGCANAGWKLSGRVWGNNSAVEPVSQSALPPTVPHRVREFSSPWGGSLYEQRTDVYVGKTYTWDTNGVLSTTNVVYQYDYTNLYQYKLVPYERIPQTYDTHGNKGGVIYGNPRIRFLR